MTEKSSLLQVRLLMLLARHIWDMCARSMVLEARERSVRVILASSPTFQGRMLQVLLLTPLLYPASLPMLVTERSLTRRLLGGFLLGVVEAC